MFLGLKYVKGKLPQVLVGQKILVRIGFLSGKRTILLLLLNEEETGQAYPT